MRLDFATNRRGTKYANFLCSGRATKQTACTRRAVPVHFAERLVEDSYASITSSESHYRAAAVRFDAALDIRTARRDQEAADLNANRARLQAERDKVLAAHFPDAIDIPTLTWHQDHTPAGLADFDQRHTACMPTLATAIGGSPTRRSSPGWRSPKTNGSAPSSPNPSPPSPLRQLPGTQTEDTHHKKMLCVPVTKLRWVLAGSNR